MKDPASYENMSITPSLTIGAVNWVNKISLNVRSVLDNICVERERERDVRKSRVRTHVPLPVQFTLHQTTVGHDAMLEVWNRVPLGLGRGVPHLQRAMHREQEEKQRAGVG